MYAFAHCLIKFYIFALSQIVRYQIMILKFTIIKSRIWQPLVALFKSNLTAVCDKHMRVLYKYLYYVTNSRKQRKNSNLQTK